MGLNVTVLNWALPEFDESNLIIEIVTGIRPASLLERAYYELQIEKFMRAVQLLFDRKN